MDATDDKDLKVQQASGDLLSSFERDLPDLLYKQRKHDGTGVGPRRLRRTVGDIETYRLNGFVRIQFLILITPR
jgi:hypothetical protein